MKRLMMTLLVFCGGAQASALDDHREALERVLDAEEALGPGRLERAGGMTLECRGWRDLNARFQGLDPGESERVALKETLVYHAGGTLSWRVASHVNADAREDMRYDYDGADGLLIVDLLNKRAFRDSGPAVAAQRKRQARVVPDLLIADALAARGTLRGSGREPRALNVTLEGETLSLSFDPDTGLPRSVEYLLDMPLQGDSLVRWVYGQWEPVPGFGPFPAGYRVEINGRTYKSLECDPPVPGADHDRMALSGDIEIPQPPAAQETETPPSPGPALPVPQELADDAWLVPGIRSGFHPLLVAFDEFSVVVDAPSGWYELDQLPTSNWAAGESASSVGERLLAVARRHLPDRPPRYLVLTHWHSDHAGGLRPFVAAGVKLVGTPETLAVANRAIAARHTLVPDALTGRTLEPDTVPVDGRRVIGAGERRLELIELDGNPHAKGMLVAWLPAERILYQSDLFEPLPDRFFPSRERLPVMRWFVDWLDRSGLDPERIYAIHGTARVSTDQLKRVRSDQPGDG